MLPRTHGHPDLAADCGPDSGRTSCLWVGAEAAEWFLPAEAVDDLYKALFIHALAVPVRRRDAAFGVDERGECVKQLCARVRVCVGWQRAGRDIQVVGKSEQQEASLR